MNKFTHFTNWQCPLWTSTDMQTKVLSIPLGAFIEITLEEGGLFYVSYTDKKNNLYMGYVEKRFVEEYQRSLAFDVVDLSDIETSDPHDLPQYVNWKGVRQVNMCGEICAAHYFGVKLSDVLINWEGKKPSFFKRVFGGGKAAGTGPDDLVELFELYGTEAKKLRYPKYTPTLFRDLARDYHLTCGVKMKDNGELRGGSIRHWVVLKEVIIERKFMGRVIVYNPANNCDEDYSWDEWLKAAGVPYGVMVSKLLD